MSRIFAYCRVSTLEQNIENQKREIESAGFKIEPYRIVEEHISGSVAASDRPGFSRLLDKMEYGDVLIVTKLDRLGRNAIDIRKTVEKLSVLNIRVHCLALGGVDLTSPAGKMTMQVISAVAEFERDLLIERTHAGIVRAKREGKRFGRPPTLNDEQKKVVIERIQSGVSISAIAREFNTTRQTILRVKQIDILPRLKAEDSYSVQTEA
ncbi:Tn3 family transposase ISYps3 (plasmid) [Providencia alcalifaciens]|uniref:recombinase family protein n=1 Tax=Providencia alcalifaciens TaxID=126385 RepID=UPI001CC6E195|nr:recombinase family protein [Providencia alcalifaciens]CAG9436264.1 Tn3 family transposase ISYps3 [Providencia alcalifaciens]